MIKTVSIKESAHTMTIEAVNTIPISNVTYDHQISSSADCLSIKEDLSELTKWLLWTVFILVELVPVVDIGEVNITLSEKYL